MVACGDIARFPNLLFDDVPRRVEHWTMVTDTARRAGHTLGRYLVHGELDSDARSGRCRRSGATSTTCASSPSARSGSAPTTSACSKATSTARWPSGYHRDGQLVGVVLVGLAGRHAHYRELLAGEVVAPTTARPKSRDCLLPERRPLDTVRAPNEASERRLTMTTAGTDYVSLRSSAGPGS